MTYSIDDVMPGDVVTYERGNEDEPGHERVTMKVVKGEVGDERAREVTLDGLDTCLRFDWRLVDVRRREPINWVAVPTDALLDLLAVWDDQSGHIQGIWRKADEEHPRTALRAKVAAFIDTTRAEWDRAGIEP